MTGLLNPKPSERLFCFAILIICIPRPSMAFVHRIALLVCSKSVFGSGIELPQEVWNLRRQILMVHLYHRSMCLIVVVLLVKMTPFPTSLSDFVFTCEKKHMIPSVILFRPNIKVCRSQNMRQCLQPCSEPRSVAASTPTTWLLWSVSFLSVFFLLGDRHFVPAFFWLVDFWFFLWVPPLPS